MSRVLPVSLLVGLCAFTLAVRGRRERASGEPANVSASTPTPSVASVVVHPEASRDWPPEPSLRNETLLEWVTRDPAAAWEWAVARAPGDEGTWQNVLGWMTDGDVERAFSLATEFVRARPEVTQIAYAALLDPLAQSGNYPAAKRILEQIPQSDAKRHLVTNLALQWGRDDPLAAADWLLGLPVQADHANAFVQLGKAWAEVRPEEAAEVLLRLPEGELRGASLAAALTVWIEKNPGAASAWLEQLAPHPDLDRAAARMARVPQLVQTRVDVALSWAESIVDANERLQTVGSVVILWADQDRGAAVRYVRSSAILNSAQRASLLEDLGTEPASL